jgi:glycosyltransferase involved in cell wall biosynthesis
MRLAVLDMHRGGGHHFAYVRAVIKEAQRRGWASKVVLSKEATEHASFDLVSDLFGPGHSLSVLSGLPAQSLLENRGWLPAQFRRFAEARYAYAQACEGGFAPDAVFHPDCDGWYAAGALKGSPTGSVRSVSVAFSIRFHRESFGATSEMSGLKRNLQRYLVEGLLKRGAVETLFVSDEMLIDYYGKRSNSWSQRLRYIPEIADVPPLTSKSKARRFLQIPEDAHVVLCFGYLSRRKGIPELLQAIGNPSCPPNVSVLLAGEADPDTRTLLSTGFAQSLRAQGRVFWEEGFLDDERSGVVFSAADTAWLGYRKFGNSSAFLWQATSAQMPVIGCANGLIGYWTTTRGLGPVVSTENVESVVQALRRVAIDSEERARWTANCASESYAHSPERFGNIICEALSGNINEKPRPMLAENPGCISGSN